ncbi:hypothetical protein [Streptomyces sp. H27-S2]|uniref:hypothetical protein n=1 Tax=Streptomyces antarcticus TaxID=2996458 RepID=UPI0022720B6B|nr:hypothetical protein [Streptomyces sp. H27-S2]MCY0952743.1 hypothetical protein [Streptomyces sp. H27-S2]
MAVVVPEPGRRNHLVRADFPVGAPAPAAAEGSGAAEALVVQIKESLGAGEIGAVELFASCDGIVETGTGARPVEGMFALSVEVSEGFFQVGLTTFSDAWMPFDLRGHEQEAVFAANRPRLASALAELSGVLDLEVDPEDATWFGIPTESGVENHYEDDDGTPSDVWGRFEIPYRNGIFSQTPKFAAGYGRQTSGPVRYVPVLGEPGVLGYLWASDTDGAASFEARDEADLEAYRAGLVWLDRLQEAYDRGLLPSVALAELMEHPGDPVSGQAGSAELTEVDEFWKLRELAQS